MGKNSSHCNEGDDRIIVGAVEGGGTSFVVAVVEVVVANNKAGRGKEGFNNHSPRILHRIQVDSSHDDPTQTLEECAAFLKEHKPTGGYHGLGVATFGPVGIHEGRPNEYGRILPSTPKQAWRNVDILTPLREACSGNLRPLAVKIETDVNAPALAEYLEIRGRDGNSNGGAKISSLAYITVGTGVGVGLVINEKCVHGRMHPEGGHIPVQPLDGDTFGGYSWGDRCPFGGKNTVEGLASSVALAERLQKDTGVVLDGGRDALSQISDDHEIWDHAANAIANLCATLLLFSLEKIVLGGGIMKRRGLLGKVHKRTVELVNGYLELPKLDDDDKAGMSELISNSTFGDDAGLMGAIVLAKHAYDQQQEEDRHNRARLDATTAKISQRPEREFVRGVLLGGFVAAACCVCLGVFGKRPGKS